MNVTGIWLRRIGDELHVCAEVDEVWLRVITTPIDGNISHIVEESGIAKAPADELQEGLLG